MDAGQVVTVARQTIWVIVKTSVPLLLVSMIVGLIISLFQTLTSIQEQTLTFVPKLLAIMIALMIMGNWLLNEIVSFMQMLWGSQLSLIEVEQFQRPAAALHIHGVHAQQTVGKQSGFLSPCPAPDLHDDVLFVPRVPGQQQNFEIIFQLCHILTFFADFLLYHLLEVRMC